VPAIRRRLARTGGDYKAYRKAYQAWNKRERTRRTKPQPQSCAAATPDAAVHAAVNKADATPVKRRRMMPRPRRTDFDTEEDFEDAMAERGAARDLRRQEAHAQAEAERRERLRSGEHAAEVADREADQKRGARRLAAALDEARAGAADNEAGASSCQDDRRRRLEQQDLILALEEMLEPQRAQTWHGATRTSTARSWRGRTSTSPMGPTRRRMRSSRSRWMRRAGASALSSSASAPERASKKRLPRATRSAF